ncbi:MAG: hypothetical protein WC998_06345 [Candidatus Paceibacterota bacterium]
MDRVSEEFTEFDKTTAKLFHLFQLVRITDLNMKELKEANILLFEARKRLEMIVDSLEVVMRRNLADGIDLIDRHEKEKIRKTILTKSK